MTGTRLLLLLHPTIYCLLLRWSNCCCLFSISIHGNIRCPCIISIGEIFRLHWSPYGLKTTNLPILYCTVDTCVCLSSIHPISIHVRGINNAGEQVKMTPHYRRSKRRFTRCKKIRRTVKKVEEEKTAMAIYDCWCVESRCMPDLSSWGNGISVIFFHRQLLHAV